MVTFFDPLAICKTTGSSPGALLNMAMLFHEALHGYYGLQDAGLLSAFNKPESSSSNVITFYLNENVLGSGATSCGP